MLGLLGLLTAVFLAAVLSMELLAFDGPWKRAAQAGLFAVGTPWAILFLTEQTGFSGLPWLIPAAYLAALGFWGRRWWGQWKRRQDVKARGEWSCPGCGAENDAISRVCYRCRAWRP